MKYEKPKVHVLAPAIDAVQRTAKGATTAPDVVPPKTGPAYEADE